VAISAVKQKSVHVQAHKFWPIKKRLSGPLPDKIDILVNDSKVLNGSLINSDTLSNSQRLTALDSIE
jgi:predicted ATPase with chaperone activity